jgi:hypothetical protein
VFIAAGKLYARIMARRVQCVRLGVGSGVFVGRYILTLKHVFD